MFDETLSTWKTDTVYFYLKENAKPILSGPYPVPKVQEKMINKEAVHLFLLVVLKNPNDSELGAPFSPQPKPNCFWVNFPSESGNLNNKLERKPHLMHQLNAIGLRSFWLW